MPAGAVSRRPVAAPDRGPAPSGGRPRRRRSGLMAGNSQRRGARGSAGAV